MFNSFFQLQHKIDKHLHLQWLWSGTLNRRHRFFLVSQNKLHLVKSRSEQGCFLCCAFGDIFQVNKSKCFIFRGNFIPEDLFILTYLIRSLINFKLYPIIKSIIFARTFFVCLWKNIANTDKWSFFIPQNIWAHLSDYSHQKWSDIFHPFVGNSRKMYWAFLLNVGV